jgi:hypothetical protein
VEVEAMTKKVATARKIQARKAIPKRRQRRMPRNVRHYGAVTNYLTEAHYEI